MSYNLSAISNISVTLDFIQKMDNHIHCIPSACGGEGGLLGTMMVLIIFGVMMFNFISNGRDFNSSLSAASFISLVICGLFFLMEIISDTTIYITLLVWGISVAIGSKR